MVLVSVIIPLYNKKNYIGRTIQSVLDQTISDFEIIVIDDGSLDGSSDVVKSFHDNRIQLFWQKNQGVSAARNNGVRRASADFIAFLDADDEWLPNHLGTLLKLRNTYPDAGAFTTAYRILEASEKIRPARYRAIPAYPWEGLIPNYFKSAALGDSPMNSSSIGIPKIVFNEFGGFPEGVWWGEDTDLFGKIALKYPIAFSWEIGAVYHWNASNRACTRPSVNIEPFVITGLEALQKCDISPEIRYYLEEYISRKELYRAICILLQNDRESAVRILKNIKTRIFFFQKCMLFLLSFIPQKTRNNIIEWLLYPTHE
ncbi:MAG: glycosyltransferase family A protein [Methanoregulaceae archaeon]|jgi:glycosyltransferase involved in cell wall biosynthesis